MAIKNHTAGGYGWKVGNNSHQSALCGNQNFPAITPVLVEIFESGPERRSDWQTAGQHFSPSSRVLYVLWARVTSLPASSNQTLLYNVPLHLAACSPTFKGQTQQHALQCSSKNTQRLFSSPSVLPLKEATAGDVTWLGNDDDFQHSQLHTHNRTHLLKFHFVKFIDVPDEVRCPLRVKSCDSQSAHQLLI